jgi:hypothetical protein
MHGNNHCQIKQLKPTETISMISEFGKVLKKILSVKIFRSDHITAIGVILFLSKAKQSECSVLKRSHTIKIQFLFYIYSQIQKGSHFYLIL